MKRSCINQDHDYIQDLLRDASATVSSGNFLRQTIVGFCPPSGMLSIGLKSGFSFERKRYYPQVFDGIVHPTAPEDMSYLPTPTDARFYVNIRCPAGLVCKLEIIDGGKISSIRRELALFPKLSEIIRFQQLRSIEKDQLLNINQSLFRTSRQQFLEHLFWPETTNRLLYLQNRQKISSQLLLAKTEYESRAPVKNLQEPQPGSSKDNVFTHFFHAETSSLTTSHINEPSPSEFEVEPTVCLKKDLKRKNEEDDKTNTGELSKYNSNPRGTKKKKPPLTSFTRMSSKDLCKWIKTSTELLQNGRRPSTVSVSAREGPPFALCTVPQEMRYSFIDYNEERAKITYKATWDGVQIGRHPANLGSMAQIGLSMPLSVQCNTIKDQSPLLPLDNARYNKPENSSVKELIHFLSYGTFKAKECPANPVIVIDQDTQTISF